MHIIFNLRPVLNMSLMNVLAASDSVVVSAATALSCWRSRNFLTIYNTIESKST